MDSNQESNRGATNVEVEIMPMKGIVDWTGVELGSTGLKVEAAVEQGGLQRWLDWNWTWFKRTEGRNDSWTPRSRACDSKLEISLQRWLKLG